METPEGPSALPLTLSQQQMSETAMCSLPLWLQEEEETFVGKGGKIFQTSVPASALSKD